MMMVMDILMMLMGGISSEGKLYEYSGYGNIVNIYAPSGNIYCLFPESKYNYSEGVSVSVAFVTGTIALAKSINPTLACQQIKDTFQSSYNKDVGLPILDTYKLCSYK